MVVGFAAGHATGKVALRRNRASLPRRGTALRRFEFDRDENDGCLAVGYEVAASERPFLHVEKTVHITLTFHSVLAPVARRFKHCHCAFTPD
ncbi:hypothetical protein CPB85DRAFT_810322 [Mucidula mucida]|nr:hypothetical protein CPB85DRAFT_810322 [Mucidula mucida]